MERITADDRLMLWPDERWPQDVGALGVLDGRGLSGADGRFRLAAAQDAVLRRLGRLPRFRQVLYTPKLERGLPLWVDDPRFDIAHHVDVAQVPSPGDEAQLLRTVEHLRRRRLDPARPLWEMWFLPGLPDSRVGLFIRLHHVVADGIAGVADLAAFLDESPEATAPDPQPWEPSPRPSDGELLAENLGRARTRMVRALAALGDPVGLMRRGLGAWPFLREMVAEEPGPRTSLDQLVGPDRAFALVRSDLDTVRDVARTYGATVNDVLLAVTAAGVRGLLESRVEAVPDAKLPVYVPVSLRTDRGAPAMGNLITQMVVRLPLGLADAGARLRVIAAETAKRKVLARRSLGTTFRGRLVSALLLRLIVRQRVNVETADLTGPREPLYFAGAKLLEVFPLLNLIGNVALSVGAISYAGEFNILVLADGDGYPDLGKFAAAAEAELDALAGRSQRSRPTAR